MVFGKQLWLLSPWAPSGGCALCTDWCALIDVHWLYIDMVSWNLTSNSILANKVGFESRSLLTGCTCRETLSDLLGAAPLITEDPRAPVSTCLCKSVVGSQKKRWYRAVWFYITESNNILLHSLIFSSFS